MLFTEPSRIPIGTRALILSKYYYGVLSKQLEGLEVERYFSVLYFLNENNGCNQQCICDHLAIDKTAMVKVIDYLQDAGFIRSKKNPNDRREKYISFTLKGAKRTQEIVKSFKLIDEQMFAEISKDEKETFLKVLSKLTHKLKDTPGDDLFFNYKKTKQVDLAQVNQTKRVKK